MSLAHYIALNTASVESCWYMGFVDVRLNMRLMELAFEIAAYGMELTYGLMTIRGH